MAVSPRWHAPLLLVALLLALPALTQAAPAGGVRPSGIGGGVDTESMAEGEAEFDEIEALKAKAAQEGDWKQSHTDQIKISDRIFTKPWNKAPFGSQAFDYTPEQLKEKWPELMDMIRIPYPSAAYLRDRYNRFPIFRERHSEFDGDFDKLSADVVNVWRLFFRGDYQEAQREGEKYGVAGLIPGKLSQIMYAIYLEPNLEEKHMLLQDAANTISMYGAALDQMKKDKAYYDDYAAIRIGYSYAIARIAEDVPIPVAIGRNYVFKLLDAANDVREIAPDHPMGLSFRAAIDANVVRKVGKAAGRMTFGAKQTDVRTFFVRALEIVPDAAILRYEYANSLLYMNKKRDIEEALKELKRAATTKPRFSMEALDAMYAEKRRKEVDALAKWPGSFRSFERKRLKFQKDNNINLYCVLPKVCPAYIIQ